MTEFIIYLIGALIYMVLVSRYSDTYYKADRISIILSSFIWPIILILYLLVLFIDGTNFIIDSIRDYIYDRN